MTISSRVFSALAISSLKAHQNSNLTSPYLKSIIIIFSVEVITSQMSLRLRVLVGKEVLVKRLNNVEFRVLFRFGNRKVR